MFNLNLKQKGKKMFSWISGKVISNFTKWSFWGALSLFGPGPVIGVVGIQGLIALGAMSHSGLVEKISAKVINAMI